MSTYTTGEIAKACGVTVRTVQYYDTRGILVPSALTEGGRRLYSEDDLRRLRVICFLRELDLPIDAIGQLLAEDDPGSVIQLLIGQQKAVVSARLAEEQSRLAKLEALSREVRSAKDFSVESIADVAHVMENKAKLKKLHMKMLFWGLPVTLLEVAVLILAFTKGVWWPVILWAVAAVVYGVWASRLYFTSTAYICPQCHETFKPAFREAFWANHTPRTRRLTCPHCGHKGFCVETWGGDEQ